MYGTDATLGPSSGNPASCGAEDPQAICVISGTSAPPMTFGYAGEAGRSFTSTDWTQWCGTPEGFGTADFNGDRLSDLYCHAADGNLWTAISDGNGGYTSTLAGAGWCKEIRGKAAVGDFDGDGRSDMLCQNVNGGPQVMLCTTQAECNVACGFPCKSYSLSCDPTCR